MNALCDRPLGAVRTASATIAWLPASRPTRRTLTGAWTEPVGGVASAASVATRISASPERAASAEARRSASARLPMSAVGSMPAMACRTRPTSDVPFATTRAVRPAAITLTLPPAGRSFSASTAAALAASSRFGVTSVACIEAEVSTTSTRSPASPAGRSMNGRAARNTSSSTSSSCSSSRRLRRSRCHGALASTSATRRCHSSVDGTTASSRRSFSRYMAMTSGTNTSPASASGARNGIAAYPTTRRRRSSANTRSASGTSVDSGTYDARRLAARSARPSCQAASRAL